jgi:hypothetical protein
MGGVGGGGRKTNIDYVTQTLYKFNLSGIDNIN